MISKQATAKESKNLDIPKIPNKRREKLRKLNIKKYDSIDDIKADVKSLKSSIKKIDSEKLQKMLADAEPWKVESWTFVKKRLKKQLKGCDELSEKEKVLISTHLRATQASINLMNQNSGKSPVKKSKKPFKKVKTKTKSNGVVKKHKMNVK